MTNKMTTMKTTAMIILSLGMAYSSVAQEPNYGDTPEEQQKCRENISLYREFRDQKAIEDAIVYWRKAVAVCPESAKTLYTDGVKFYEYFIEKETNEDLKNAYIDTLMQVYDLRVKYYGEEGAVLGYKGVALYKYRPNDVQEANLILKKGYEMTGNETDALVISKYYQSLYDLYKEKKATKSDLLVEYMPVADILEYNIQRLDDERARGRYESAKHNLDAFFIKIADCDDIYKILGESIAKDPNNIELNLKSLQVMNMRDCQDSDLYVQVAERVYAHEPTPEAAYSLGIMKLKAKNYSEAMQYFQSASDLCGDCVGKRLYLMRSGQTAILMGQTSRARGYASEMIRLNARDGEAYILMGDAIATSSKACDDGKLGASAVYWLAVDYYTMAKTKDPKTTERANAKINAYTKYFPEKKDAFFHGLTDGQSYLLECIGESTTVRTN
jgi:tetratricopeptide (TPR) repeat protein